LKKLDIAPEHAIMVGDWVERDMVGAKNVGMHTAFAQYGDSFGNQDVKADYILEDISQLLQIVQSHNAS
jgi:putative hydrolase of the HAD superfamily